MTACSSVFLQAGLRALSIVWAFFATTPPATMWPISDCPGRYWSELKAEMSRAGPSSETRRSLEKSREPIMLIVPVSSALPVIGMLGMKETMLGKGIQRYCGVTPVVAFNALSSGP